MTATELTDEEHECFTVISTAIQHVHLTHSRTLSTERDEQYIVSADYWHLTHAVLNTLIESSYPIVKNSVEA
jgi:hypothetical protein